MITADNCLIANTRLSKCCICNVAIRKQERIIQWTPKKGRFHIIHTDCIKIVNEFIEKNEQVFVEKLEIHKRKERIHKDNLKKVRLKRDWKKSIVKEALKTTGLQPSKLTISNPADYGTWGEGDLIKIAEKSRDQRSTPAFVFIQFMELKVRIYSPMQIIRYPHRVKDSKELVHATTISVYDLNSFKTYIDVELADPNSLSKIGKAILTLHEGDLSPYFRRQKV